jgi:hypothetical protein
MEKDVKCVVKDRALEDRQWGLAYGLRVLYYTQERNLKSTEICVYGFDFFNLNSLFLLNCYKMRVLLR